MCRLCSHVCFGWNILKNKHFTDGILKWILKRISCLAQDLNKRPLLTHCGLMTLHDYIHLDQYRFRQWHVAWRQQAITWINANLPSMMFCWIYMTAIAQEVLMNLIRNMCSEFKSLTLLLHPPRANESNASLPVTIIQQLHELAWQNRVHIIWGMLHTCR